MTHIKAQQTFRYKNSRKMYDICKTVFECNFLRKDTERKLSQFNLNSHCLQNTTQMFSTIFLILFNSGEWFLLSRHPVCSHNRVVSSVLTAEVTITDCPLWLTLLWHTAALRTPCWLTAHFCPTAELHDSWSKQTVPP